MDPVQQPPDNSLPQQIPSPQQVYTTAPPLSQNAPSSEQSVGIIVLVILALIFMYPAGLILMWVLMKKWPTWVKVILTLPILILPLAIFLAITLIAINPSKQFAQASNTKRRSDVNTILNAVNQYKADKGTLPASLPTTKAEISSIGADLCKDLVPTYVAQLPVDPLVNKGEPIDTSCPSGYTTGYSIMLDPADNRVTVSAPRAELQETLSVTR